MYQHGLDYELGTWSEEWRGKSPNVCEAENLTDRLECLAAESVGLAAEAGSGGSTWYANAYNAGENFSCETVVGLDQKKQYVSTGHTFGKWFSRFMRGARLRMGMVRRQNEALSSNW